MGEAKRKQPDPKKLIKGLKEIGPVMEFTLIPISEILGLMLSDENAFEICLNTISQFTKGYEIQCIACDTWLSDKERPAAFGITRAYAGDGRQALVSGVCFHCAFTRSIDELHEWARKRFKGYETTAGTA